MKEETVLEVSLPERLPEPENLRLGLGSLPRGVSWAGVLVVGCVAGIGFTMALFIGALAFTDESMMAIAKLTVLAASAVAGIVGLVVGYKFLDLPDTAETTI